jgi:hypothetical protein
MPPKRRFESTSHKIKGPRHMSYYCSRYDKKPEKAHAYIEQDCVAQRSLEQRRLALLDSRTDCPRVHPRTLPAKAPAESNVSVRLPAHRTVLQRLWDGIS